MKIELLGQVSDSIIHIISRKIGTDDFRSFMMNHSLPYSGSNVSRFYQFFNKTANRSTDERAQLQEELEEFVAHSLQFGQTRIIDEATFDLKPTPDSIEEIPAYRSTKNKSEFSFSKLLNFSVGKYFSLIYRVVDVDNVEKLSKITMCFARKFTPIDTNDKAELVWIIIDFKNRTWQMRRDARTGNRIDDKLASTSPQLFKYFRKILAGDYAISTEESSDQQTLFKMFEHFTRMNEEEFSDVITKYDKQIQSLCQGFLKEQSIDPHVTTLKLDSRVRNLLLRMLISSKFERYEETQHNMEASVRSFGFNASEDTSLSAKSGPVRGYRSVEQISEFSIEHTAAYFDNRETIEQSQRLFLISLLWMKNSTGLDNDVLVKYIAYSGFTETHFQLYALKEEEYNVVFPKLEDYRI
ncbi:hypothetical protein Lpl7_0259 [Lacticaseibacillus paracasei subsp. tolerans Lpl7]|uniref:Uncharacterized protein n=2 Tax=Lacticaseibacillus paracasei TaxID=1597 RepID=A0A829GS29_LACPA|nr:hypothetical protein [Lacticaseibacillus paracasei]EPC54149.1 hypothetical protein Lpp77_07843 [Lacticaseibacillus paracasei subsp. paracasei CNCM I-4270]EKQ14084.1 hypothetical protein LCAT71499_1259 [Lacticaseibacillus paracasei]EPC16075.1 hypothetical protein Lpl7_0259 [Lacticaseibacillus paracasei subsp. tolerans Lpl7]EPC63057.1 hypothetical protein Lpl14_13577 [Lacticaseibacillus paracasei subsp. tolerans Lpl14]MDE3289482.1 hypothetical protein [Lacticaseibacillus paracasei]